MSDIPSLERRFVRLALTLGAGFFLTLTAVLVLRPPPRHSIPGTPQEVLPDLAALHQGKGPCLRWEQSARLDRQGLEDFQRAWSQDFALDLHLLLPWLSHLRAFNETWERERHASPRAGEFQTVALQHLHVLDRLRVEHNEDTLHKTLPALEHFDHHGKRLEQDQARWQRLAEKLSAEDRQKLRSLTQTWHTKLASPEDQGWLLYEVAHLVTHQRLSDLQKGLKRYRRHHGHYPTHLSKLLALLKNTQQSTDVIERGMEADGSIRDGWLRPLTYYRVGKEDYRLISLGPGEEDDEDDLIYTASSARE